MKIYKAHRKGTVPHCSFPPSHFVLPLDCIMPPRPSRRRVPKRRHNVLSTEGYDLVTGTWTSLLQRTHETISLY